MVDKELILRKLKDYKKFKSDAEFARFIGVGPTVLATWYKRNSFNISKIANVFPEVSEDFLLTGNGPMLKKDKIVVPIPPPSASHDVEIYKKLVASLEETVASQKLIIQKLTDELKLINQRANIAVAVQTAKRARRRAANGRGAIAASAEPSDD